MNCIRKMLWCVLTAVIISLCFVQSVFAKETHDHSTDIALNNIAIENYYDGNELVYILPSGAYYLDEDMSNLSYDIVIKQNETVSICLNGHIFELLNTREIRNYGKLTLCECRDTPHYYDFPTDNSQKKWTYNSSATTGIDYDQITQNDIDNHTFTTVKVPGGAIINGWVAILNQGNLVIDGANIIGNTGVAVSNSNLLDYFADEILVQRATAELKSGRILGCSGSGNGGALSVSGGTVNMYDGFEISFTNGISTVMLYTEEGFVGTFNMYGGKFTFNKGAFGGVANTHSGTFNMYGGEMTHNYGGCGSAICNMQGSTCFNMYGGIIEENTGSYAVYNSTGVIRVTGNAIIRNNTKNGKEANLATEVPITVIENDDYHGLTQGASIGITANVSNSSIPFVFTNETSADYSQYFHSDNADLYVINEKASTDKNVSKLVALEIVEQPCGDNDYTVKAKCAEGKTLTYQWNKMNRTGFGADIGNISLYYGTKDAIVDNITATEYSDQYAIDFYVYGYDFFEFDYDGDVDITGNYATLISKTGNHYLYQNIYGELGIFGDEPFTIKNVCLSKATEITNDTKARFEGATLENAVYFCRVSCGDFSVFSNLITTINVTYQGNGATSGDSYTNYILAKRIFKLPTNTFAKTGANFIGWYDGKAVYDEEDDYSLEEDAFLNCEWSDQQHIFVNEDAQQYIYDGTAKAFAIIGAPNNINDIQVSYFIDGSWTETAPSDAGVYDVKLKRSAKGNYCDFDLTIEKALEICPVLDKVNNIAIEEGGKGEYYVGKAENLPAHIDGMQLKHIAGTDEEGNSDDYSAVLVYRDLNEDGECSDGEALTYSADYTLQSGSVIVMLSKDYINTLEVGEYQITVEITCKSGRTYQFMVPITILEALKPVPPTGEIQWRSSVLPIATLSLAAVISGCVVLKKKRDQQ